MHQQQERHAHIIIDNEVYTDETATLGLFDYVTTIIHTGQRAIVLLFRIILRHAGAPIPL